MADVMLQDWVGRTETLADVLTAGPLRALHATLAPPGAPDLDLSAPLSPLTAWIAFLPIVPMDQVGPDGHPKRGGFLPPVPLERRMWAGSRLSFHTALHAGVPLERTSTILKVAEKDGKSGPMVFVTVRHAVFANGQCAIEEEQDIVYLPMPQTFAPPPPTPVPATDWSEPVSIDPVLLFRFSALTFNGHRIHYDRTYAADTERYPGLVVHGPLQAMLLFNAAQRHNPGRRARSYTFRGLRPLFDFDTVRLGGVAREDGGLDLYTSNADGAVGMQASLLWHDD